jgi:hypothetical protein
MANYFCNGSSDSGGGGEDEFRNRLSPTIYNTQHEDRSDDYIANALNQMSLKERDEVYCDLHGVAKDIVEDPEFVGRKLEELQLHVDQISPSNSKAFRLVELQSPSFVNNRKIRLRFLRAEAFDSRKAATRMMRFFDFKLVLFGEDRLCRDITYFDLNDEDQTALKTGFTQRLSERDRAGRAVIVLFMCHLKAVSARSLVSTAGQTISN